MDLTTLPTFTFTEFRRSSGKVMEAAQRGPVVLTRRGKPVLVMLPVSEYERLGSRKSAA